MTAAVESPRLFAGKHRSLSTALLAAVALVAYNNLAVTAALPSIGDDLGQVSLVPWVITSELLASAVAVLGLGPTIDTNGVRRVFRLSMIAFIVSSLVCALAPSMPVLVAARVGQGIAGGGVMGSAMSSIGLAYPESLRPRAYALVSGVWGVMGVGGPALAALLISVLDWRWVFGVSVPIGIAATVLSWSELPQRRADAADEVFDRRGLALVTLLTVGLLLAASATTAIGLLWFGAAAGAGAVYLRHERRRTSPVVRVGHLIARRWRHVHATSTLAVAGGTGASAFLPLYLRGARDASESEAAFSVLFMTLGWSTASWVASKLQERMHPAHVVRGGAAVLIVSIGAATAVTALELPVWLLLAVFTLVGAGIGSITSSGLAILQGRAAAAEMGRVTSAHQFVRSLGFAYGAAAAGAVLFIVVARQIGDVEAIRELLGGEADGLDLASRRALQDGYVWALAVTGLFTIIAGASSVRLVQNIGRFSHPD